MMLRLSFFDNSPTSVITGFRIYYKTAKMINAVP